MQLPNKAYTVLIQIIYKR